MSRIAVLLGCFAFHLAAHDLYLMPAKFAVKPGERLIVAIHTGDSFPESEDAPVVARLRDVKLSGVPIERLRRQGNKAVGEVPVKARGTLILTTRSIPNFIEQDAAKFEQYLIEEGLDHVLQYRREHNETKKPGLERYAKFAKSIVISAAPDDGYNKTAGFDIEFIPEQNPELLKVGGELSVQVLRHGRPAFNLTIEASNEKDTKVIGRLDSAGRIRIPITRAGRWRLHTISMRRATEPKAIGDVTPEAKTRVADWESIWASLTFEVIP